ncbi:TetR/AcrR family transcriptional regulator [Nocardioides insulae]|uniref:TetR/AcrR family transcriptional regulator n=1 Tax=Nocardioides insulae TaxID=394734 RepID=UPI000420A214|nr:TetR/AcrR family transcriptional regulator [Nocardioides insulae]
MTDQATRADTSRARLIDAAVSAFAEKGFHGTTTRDIASAAGMSPAALYVHHRSKEELLHQISKEAHQRTLDAMDEAVASQETPTRQLHELVRVFAVHHAHARTRARIVNYELSALSPEHHREIVELRQAIDQRMRDLVESGVAAGEFDVPDAGLATTALLSLGVDIARWYRTDGSWTPEDVGDAYAALALRIVGARPL